MTTDAKSLAENYSFEDSVPHMSRTEPAWHYSQADFLAGFKAALECDEVVAIRTALESLYTFPGVTKPLASRGSLGSIRDQVEIALKAFDKLAGGGE